MLTAALLLATASLMAAPLVAQQVPPSALVDAKTLRATGDALLQQAKASKDGMAYTMLLERPDGNEQVTVRVKSGHGELHRGYVDVLVALEGEAQVVTGGTMVNGKESMPGEILGDSVSGGKVQTFRAGDAIRIEAGVAHQFLLAPGASIRYFVVKLKVK